MGRIATLKRFSLHLTNNTHIIMHDVKVVKDTQVRHLVHLIGNPVEIELTRIIREERITVRQGIRKLGRIADVPLSRGLGKKAIRMVVGGKYISYSLVVRAFSDELGLNNEVKELPEFIVRLLA